MRSRWGDEEDEGTGDDWKNENWRHCVQYLVSALPVRPSPLRAVVAEDGQLEMREEPATTHRWSRHGRSLRSCAALRRVYSSAHLTQAAAGLRAV